MGNKPKEIDFEAEYELQLAKLRSSIGQEVPLSHHYVRGAKPILIRMRDFVSAEQTFSESMLACDSGHSPARIQKAIQRSSCYNLAV